MTDFDYDRVQRKKLANQAKHRKCGSKSKKCSLSTDHMTDKQWKERNGKLEVMNLNSPLSWDGFKSLSKTMQKDYVDSLVSRFGVNAKGLGEMFGVSGNAFQYYAQKNDLEFKFRRGVMSKGQKELWNEFVGVTTNQETDLVDECDIKDETEPAQEVPNQIDQAVDGRDAKTIMKKFTLVFDGKIDVNVIANSLLHMVGKDSVGEIEISCNLA